MEDDNKSKEQFVVELTELRSQNAMLKKLITGSISAELAAEEARRYAVSIVETVRGPLLVLDADLKIISANRSFYRTFKVTPDETIGSFIYDLGNKQWDIPKLRELLEEVLPEKETFDDFEVTHDFQDIGHKIMLLNARQIHRKDIGAKMILLAIEDITERKEIEDGLEKTRKELAVIKIAADEVSEYAESIINTVREPLIALDQELRVVTASRSFYKVFKVTPEETVGKLIYDLGNKQWDIPKLRELLETILPQKTTFDDYEVEHDFADIGRRTMLLNARQIQRVLGKERIILLAVEDITEHKRTEGELLRTQKLESLGILAGGIAHDFNNLMTVVLGNVQLAMMGLPSNHTSYPLLQAVLQSAEQTRDLTSRLITFSKGGFPIKQISDVSGVLQEVVRKMVKGTVVRGAFDIVKDLWSAKVDENQIRQVFYNLTMNAIEAMPEGGTLTIQAHNTKVHSSDGLPLKEGSYLRIIFADNGTGIAEENLVRIFDPYFTTKGMGNQKGMGLGLSVCYSVLKKHDGHIAVTSRAGGGTAFTLYLPALAEKAHAAKIERVAPPSSSPNRALLMEDEIHVRALERAFLERLGYEVTETGDGREAIDRYKEAFLLNNPFDLVILDLTVCHGLGGQLTMERLLKEDPSVKAIIASGYVDEPVIEHYKDYGFRGALKKPFSFQEFGEMVKKVIGTEP